VNKHEPDASPISTATASAERYSGALHEVSNALTVVLGWLDRARRSGSLEEAQKALLVAQEHARRGQTMARSAIGADAPSSFESRPAADLAEFAATSVTPQASGREVEIEVETFAGTDVRVESDGQVLQVLTNLLLNAIDFSPLGAKVQLSVVRQDSSLVFRVRDFGPGVANEIATGLFTSVKSTRPGGAGIGLPHSRSIARENGGDLNYVPLPEGAKGACFELTWPAAPSAAVPPSQAGGADGSLSGTRVLLVEDDASICSLIELTFEAHGAHVLAIADPSRIDEVLSSRPMFDVALLDLSPIRERLDEIFARLGNLSPGAPVILMSGEPTGVPDEASGRFASWIRKPFDMDQLLHTVSSLLREAKEA